MKNQLTETHFIAVIDCSCGKRTPVSTVGPFCKEGYNDIYVSFCPVCKRIVYDESKIVGYVSIEELEEMGWQKVEDTGD